MKMHYKIIRSSLLLASLFFVYSFSESKKEGLKHESQMDAQKQPYLPVCQEIEKYPAVFSYLTEEVKKQLDAKCITPLSSQEKAMAFMNNESFPEEIYSEFFQVFAINKINYTTATLMIYLIEEVQTESVHEKDRLLLVIYDKQGIMQDFLSRNLQDVFGSRQFQFTTKEEFTIMDTDSEYSPDPESEAEDRRNGRAPEPSVSTIYYQIDPVKMKFRMLD